MIIYMIYSEYYIGCNIIPTIFLHTTFVDEQLANEYINKRSSEDCKLFIKELWVDEPRKDINHGEWSWIN